jgi:alpha/beta superfamily hydrolase
VSVTALRIGAEPRVLDAVVEGPADARAGAVVCHPHPQYGGNMRNGVVVAAARALAATGLAALRFDFGREYSGGPRELDDAAVARAALAERLPAGAPISLVGYSFGAWIALQLAAREPAIAGVVAIAPPLDLLAWEPGAGGCPIVCVVGDRDQYCRSEALASLVARGGGRVVARILGGADHFFAGREVEVAGAVVAGLAPSAR